MIEIKKKIDKNLILDVYNWISKIRELEGIGQRKLARKVKDKFDVDIPESTISGWIHHGNVPFNQEKTQFQLKEVPEIPILLDLYVRKQISASKIGKMFGVSCVTALNWLRGNHIEIRSEIESMNTPKIKKELREQKLIFPKNKNYDKLTKEKAYLLGTIAGDGHINKNFIRFEIKNDLDFINEFSDYLWKVYGNKYLPYYYKLRDSYIVYVASQIICEDILRYGNFMTENWFVPNEISSSTDEQIISFYLRGLFDSEAYADRYNIIFSSNSKRGIYGIQSLLDKLEINSKMRRQNKNYRLRIGRRENLLKYKDKIGFTIKRKMEKLP
jgi:hypothetical protein